MLIDSRHIVSFLPLFFTVKAHSTLCYCLEQDVCEYITNEMLNSASLVAEYNFSWRNPLFEILRI